MNKTQPSTTPPLHIVQAVEKMDPAIERVSCAKNLQLFITDYLE